MLVCITPAPCTNHYPPASPPPSSRPWPFPLTSLPPLHASSFPSAYLSFLLSLSPLLVFSLSFCLSFPPCIPFFLVCLSLPPFIPFSSASFLLYVSPSFYLLFMPLHLYPLLNTYPFFYQFSPSPVPSTPTPFHLLTPFPPTRPLTPACIPPPFHAPPTPSTRFPLPLLSHPLVTPHPHPFLTTCPFPLHVPSPLHTSPPPLDAPPLPFPGRANYQNK